MIPTSWAHNSSIRFRSTDRIFLNRNSHNYRSSYFEEPEDPPTEVHSRFPLRPVMRNASSVSIVFPSSNDSMASSSPMDSRDAEERKTKVIYETTSQGDVAIVQESFDDHDGRKSPEGVTTRRSGHTRNLSEHFQDATSLSTDPTVATAGQKHRRGLSGGFSNPAQAHRRIDSIGNSAMIKRGGSRDHRRGDSTGLDVLTAAAAFSREELAAAASGGRNVTWDPSGIRRSPIEINSYDHVKLIPSQHSTGGQSHHRSYPSSCPPTGAYYGPGPSYPQSAYPPAYPRPYYSQHPGHGYGRMHPPPTSTEHYPVQYSRGQDPIIKHHVPLQQPVLENPREDNSVRQTSPTIASIEHSGDASKENPDGSSVPIPFSTDGMDPPAPPSWHGGSTQGVQTYVTAIGVGNSARTIEVNPEIVPTAGTLRDGIRRHHRKLSSFSTLAPLIFGDMGGEHPLQRGDGHHRSTSSSVSFLDALDNSDAAFLRNLQASTGASAAVLNSKETLKADLTVSGVAVSAGGAKSDPSSKLAAGGTSKRVRRKCTIDGCDNRVVQGGLCIAHGAKRKHCRHPGCTKHVKKAGLCSTHGPARKRCEAEGCTKVAVQGGRCIAHGAKKRTCSVGQCAKQAILSGMCKKHHDQSQQKGGVLVPPSAQGGACQVIETKIGTKSRSSKTSVGSTSSKRPSHTRGLSIFQEISPDTVSDLLSEDPTAAAAPPPRISGSPGHRHQSTFSREFDSMY